MPLDTLSDRLKALGFRTASSIKHHAMEKFPSLEDAIQGKTLSNSLGEFVIKETIFPMDYQHGIVRLSNQVAIETINRTAKITHPTEVGKMLFIDTETTGLSGGTGTFAFLVGVGQFTANGFTLRQMIIRGPEEEPAMLLHLLNALKKDSSFVTFNGKSFDVPLLQNRMIINRFQANLKEFPHVDVLHLSRKLWRRKLDSCALHDLEVSILGFKRTAEDVPGWMIPDLYFEYLRTKDPARLSEVVYHNAQDILSLAAIFIHIAKILEQNEQNDDIDVDDLIAISRVYRDVGWQDISTRILQSCIEGECTPEQITEICAILGLYYKKNGGLTKAVEYWSKAANNGDLQSAIELAMYYEHTQKDTGKALEWCNIILKNIDIHKTSGDTKIHKDLIKRINRLNMKRR